jgi:hypothetical protein
LRNGCCVCVIGSGRWESLLWDVALSEVAALARGSAHDRAMRSRMIK